ncbi:MAG: hypothetical protein Q7R65_04670 [bacterium]|nr:hypothetical protein [bacterium]
MTTTPETLVLASTTGSWLLAHGSDLVIAVISATVGAIASAIFDFRKHGTNLAVKFKIINKDYSHRDLSAEAKDKSSVAQPQAQGDAVGQSVGGQGNLTLQIGGDNHGDIVLPPASTLAGEEILPYEENALMKRIIVVLNAHNVSTTFSEHYLKGFVHLREGHATLAASEYHCAFRQTKDLFLERSTYSLDLNEGLHVSLDGTFGRLAKFSDDGETEINNLREIVSGLENTLKSIFAYIP